MERTKFQQTMADLKEKNERRRYDALRKKYETAPDFTNMSLRDEIGTRYDLDELKQLKQKFGVPGGSIYNGPDCRMSFDGQNLSLYIMKEWITETLRLMKNFKWVFYFQK